MLGVVDLGYRRRTLRVTILRPLIVFGSNGRVYSVSVGVCLVVCNVMVSGDAVTVRAGGGVSAARPVDRGRAMTSARPGGDAGMGGATMYVQGNGSFVAAGTVAISSSASTVTGTGTAFLTDLQIGDRLLVGAVSRPVTAIASNTSINTKPRTAISNFYGCRIPIGRRPNS